MDQYYCRICWNGRGWVFPSGDSALSEKNSFVSMNGYGVEEWLFNFAWLINGRHYAFVQPVNRSYDRVVGRNLRLYLYSIKPDKQRVHVGEISTCHVLSESEAASAAKYYKKMGWLKQMRQHLSNIDVNPLKLDTTPLSCFNIRFRPEDVKIYDPPRAAASSAFIRKLNRYSLVPAADQEPSDARRKGRVDAPEARTVNRAGHGETTANQVELEMEGELLRALQTEFGKECVISQMDNVDLTVTTSDELMLIELKSDPIARQAIRKAIGQIMEYAYFNPSLSKLHARLFIISPGPVDDEVEKYLTFLNNTFGIPISYCRFSLGEELPAALRKRV